jgi:hypothetical protein
MKFDARDIAKAVALKRKGCTLSEIEFVLGWPASCKGAKARDLLKAVEGQVRRGGKYVPVEQIG